MPRLRFLITIIVIVACASVVAVALVTPFQAEWETSGHADASSEPFLHWGIDPNTVSSSCARCHSGTGFQDFIGADGSTVGSVDNPHVAWPAEGSLVDCTACHNSATLTMDTVQFPGVEPNYPGAIVTGLGPEARCMQCHQGRQSTATVNEKIDAAEVVDDDTVDSDLSFRNVHYAAAGATQYGGVVKGGYEYDGKSYDMKFFHTEGMESCIDCHDQHTLKVRVEKCSACHTEIATEEDLPDIRFLGSTKNYDGDTNLTEGILGEIQTIQTRLYAAIQAYASGIGAPIVYNPDSSPYWFTPTGARYSTWTARLVRATYNYQFSVKDHGAFAHNAKYLIQLMYDSIEDLGGSVANLTRDDTGHFAGSKEPFRHWDEEGEVSASCSRCHSSEGLSLYVETGITVPQEPTNGFKCSTCHDAIPGFTRRKVEEVEFPSGAVLDTGDPNSNLCIVCHQGRESAVSVNETIAGLDLDDVDALAGKRYINVHYYPAGATLFGSQAKGCYEYPGKVYSGRSRHLGFPAVDNCIECHDAHSLEILTDNCKWCHNVTKGVRTIRKDTTVDWDGDGSSIEPIADEIEGMQQALYTAMQDYASNTIGVPIIYYGGFYVDTDGDGEVDENELDRNNRYASFTPRLYQAAYNYNYVEREPGAFAHNSTYILQILYDGIESLGGNVGGMTRPGAVNPSNECGDPTHPYPQGDLNMDCNVNFLDFAIIGSNWLERTAP